MGKPRETEWEGDKARTSFRQSADFIPIEGGECENEKARTSFLANNYLLYTHMCGLSASEQFLFFLCRLL